MAGGQEMIVLFWVWMTGFALFTLAVGAAKYVTNRGLLNYEKPLLILLACSMACILGPMIVVIGIWVSKLL